MAKARILAVDDQRYFRELIEGLLTDEGYEVQTASSGEEALHILEREGIALAKARGFRQIDQEAQPARRGDPPAAQEPALVIEHHGIGSARPVSGPGDARRLRQIGHRRFLGSGSSKVAPSSLPAKAAAQHPARTRAGAVRSVRQDLYTLAP